jgi:hypothetical protein
LYPLEVNGLRCTADILSSIGQEMLRPL